VKQSYLLASLMLVWAAPASAQGVPTRAYGPPAPVEIAVPNFPSEFTVEPDETLWQADSRIKRERRSALRWQWARQALSVADTAQTLYHCGRLPKEVRCEANPIMGRHPSALRLVGTKFGLDAINWLLFTRALNRDPKQAATVAKIGFVIQASVVGLNFKTAF